MVCTSPLLAMHDLQGASTASHSKINRKALFTPTPLHHPHTVLRALNMASSPAAFSCIPAILTPNQSHVLHIGLPQWLVSIHFGALPAGTSPRGVRSFSGCTDSHMSGCVHCPSGKKQPLHINHTLHVGMSQRLVSIRLCFVRPITDRIHLLVYIQHQPAVELSY